MLILLLLMLGCVSDDLRQAQPQFIINTDPPAAAQAMFDQCVLRYSFRNSPRNVASAPTQEQLKLTCFDPWARANGFLDFVPVKSTEPAEIQIVFTDSLPPGPVNYTSKGLIAQPIPVLSRLVRQADKTCIIYLLNRDNWDTPGLQRVLLYQVGAALGLAPSNNPKSAMSGQLSAISQLDSADQNAIRRLYRNPCDTWTRLPDLPFDGRDVELGIANDTRALVLLDLGIEQSATWEYTLSSGWQSRKPYPVLQFLSSPSGFAIDNKLFVGNTYASISQPNSQGAFFQYIPAQGQTLDQWLPMSPIPQTSDRVGRAFGIDGKGYVVLAQMNEQYDQWISVSVYDPIKNRWEVPDAMKRTSVLSDFNASVLSGSMPFVLNKQAYLINADPRFRKSWLFDPQPNALPWTNTAAFEHDTYTNTGFAVRDAGYAVTGGYDSKSVWQFKPEQGWKRMADCPVKGRIVFSFVMNNKAYLGTDAGEFWQYRP